MRYRALSASGDHTFGQGNANFLVNSPATVGQSVLTRLKLLEGEWFLDVTDGTPWSTEILGEHMQDTYDAAIRARILDTDGVTGLSFYESVRDPNTRKVTVTATINTVFGQTQISGTL